MSGETVAIADIFSKTPEPEVRTGEGSLVSISDVVDGGGEKPAGIPSIPDEQATDFVAHFGGMIHNAWARAAGSMVGGVADVLDTHKILLPLSPLSGNVSDKDIVRPWAKEKLIDPLRAEGERRLTSFLLWVRK
ncbi:MAG TPA: hypothetical protein PLF98_07720, partial [Thermotogota bacterium]|nr:hypothetical protein [Thermotogota bacterium]